MVYFDPIAAFSFIALFIGIVLVIGGLYARRGGKLRHREGAAVLAGFAAAVGLLALGFGFFGLLRG